MNKEIMHCLECNKILRRTDHDDAPIFVFDKNLNDFVSVPKDDLEDFAIEHKGHHLRGLSILENSSISKMSCGDKHGIGYFKATDGKKVFLIKKWRNNINEPLHYKILEDSRIKMKNVKVTAQVDMIRIQLNKQFAWMDHSNIERFVEIVKHSVEKMDLNTLEECFWGSGNSMEVSARLGFQEVREILRECQKFLTWTQLKSIRDFIEENNCDNGVMTVLVQKKMRIVRFNLRGIKHKRNIVYNS